MPGTSTMPGAVENHGTSMSQLPGASLHLFNFMSILVNSDFRHFPQFYWNMIDIQHWIGILEISEMKIKMNTSGKKNAKTSMSYSYETNMPEFQKSVSSCNSLTISLLSPIPVFLCPSALRVSLEESLRHLSEPCMYWVSYAKLKTFKQADIQIASLL